MTGLLLALACLLAPAQAQAPDVPTEADTVSAHLDEPPLEDPPAAALAEARTKRLTKALRCPVCQGMSVADSPSDAARAMGDRIEELVTFGYTEDQITAYFVDRYGPWVELEPPAEGWHRVLFLGPLGVGLFGLIILGLRLRKRSDGAPVEAPAFVPDPELAPYRARILAKLDGPK